ncbi:MAG: InlB B-repeat-containing protein [Anaerobutyricum hallii]|uniref:InlB B-repeat-containing protein n=1 Tax=Anaerobutyricum hallii TaxID=39488 RepID=UPI00242D23D2|nr:InlB B-repeat-containing protein [Anaerobutyricum hallii]MDD6589351.1 InlB B-repeat-containing protein [Anaerobutyricum hallii]
MKGLKQCIAIMLALVMAFYTVSLDAIAAGISNDTTQISVENKNVKPGDTFNVEVKVKNNPGILGATLKLSYDSGLTLKNVEGGEAFSYLTLTKPGRFTSPCTFNWDGQECTKEDAKDGSILNLTFTVDQNVPSGKKLGVSISADKNDVFDNDLNEVPFTIKNGEITVNNYIPGDVNNDGKINVTDILLMRRYITGGYDVSINENAANVNNDTKINAFDVTLVRRYVAGGYNITLMPSTKEGCTHTKKAVSYKAPTCTEEGNIAYWYCETCKKYFSDEKGQHEIDFANTVIAALGHTEVIDPAVKAQPGKPGLTEGSHCSICGKVIIPQQEVQWDGKTYSLTYDISNGDSYLSSVKINNPNPTTVAQGESLYLEDLSKDGYRFLGWYDGAGEKATLIKKIENADHNIKLYAHWERIEYKIQFKSDLVSHDEMSYTTNSGKVLPSLKLDGYTFAGWTDFNGKEYTRVKAGTTGDITLYANWISDRNQAWRKKKLDDPLIYEDDKNGVILFTYEIGDIRNVPMYEIHDFGKINNSGVPQTVTKKYSVTTSESLMNSCAKTVASSTTDSSSWTLSKDWSDSVSVSEEYCEQNGLTKEEAESICRSDENNWYVSNSKGGSHSQSTIDSTDTYDLTTTNNNTKSWSDDYQENVSHGDNTITYDSTDHTYGWDVNGKVALEDKKNLGVEIEGIKAGRDITAGLEIGGSYESKYTDKSGSDTTIRGDDTTTFKGSVSDNSSGSQTGTVKNHTSNSTNTSSWNSESGYGASSTTSRSKQISTAISQMISEKKGYGKTYINNSGQSSTQGVTSASSESDEYSSQVTYSTAKSEEETVSYTTTNTVSGYHRWVMAGTAHVFAVVGYDISTKSYFVYNYSVMDDKMFRFEDYSYSSSDYDDNQSSVISFEVPTDIQDYVDAQMFRTDGVEVDLEGNVTAYNGKDSAVIIPDYARIDNKDGTYSVRKITGLSEKAFQGNKNITGVKLSKYIDTIPANAFKGCTSLWDVLASAKSIGDNAFANCPLLEDWNISSAIYNLGKNAFSGAKYVTVNAVNEDVVQNAIKSGAKNIIIGISAMKEAFDKKDSNKKWKYSLDNITLDIPKGTKDFILKGYGNSYKNLNINSKAEQTILNRINIDGEGTIPLQLESPKVGLYQLTVNNAGICSAMLADKTSVDLYGAVQMKTAGDNALLCKNTDFLQSTAGLATKLNLKGDIVTCGNITGNEYLNFISGKIRKVDAATFDKMLHSYTITFDANGGKCDTASMDVANATPIGKLPTATKTGFGFDGWYLKDGTKVTEKTVFSSGENQTFYAHWSAKKYNVKWTDGTGKNISVTRTSSPYKKATTGKLTNGDAIYYGDILQVTYSTLTNWTIDSHGKEKITVTGNVTSADIYMTVWSDWSEWSDDAATESNTVKVESKSQYRYSDKATTTSTNASLPGWIQTGSTTSYGNWGGWSNWQIDAIGGSDTRDVQTGTVYGYYYYRCPNCGAHMHVYTQCYTWAGGCGAKSMNAGCAVMMWSETPWNNAGIYEFHGTGKYATDSLPGGRWFKWATNESIRTGYRYRDRSKTITYSYYKWNDWSSWSDTAYSSNDNRKVDTKTVYRIKKKY